MTGTPGYLSRHSGSSPVSGRAASAATANGLGPVNGRPAREMSVCGVPGMDSQQPAASVPQARLLEGKTKRVGTAARIANADTEEPVRNLRLVADDHDRAGQVAGGVPADRAEQHSGDCPASAGTHHQHQRALAALSDGPGGRPVQRFMVDQQIRGCPRGPLGGGNQRPVTLGEKDVGHRVVLSGTRTGDHPRRKRITASQAAQSTACSEAWNRSCPPRWASMSWHVLLPGCCRMPGFERSVGAAAPEALSHHRSGEELPRRLPIRLLRGDHFREHSILQQPASRTGCGIPVPRCHPRRPPMRRSGRPATGPGTKVPSSEDLTS